MKINQLFQKHLTILVIICMILGIFISKYFIFIPNFLMKFEYANISIPITIIIWFMIYPMMLKVDFKSVKKIENMKGLFITWIINWLIKPFTMYVISYLFLFIFFEKLLTNELAYEFHFGMVLLGVAPCTAMVFVWSNLTKGDASYTMVQVATNDILIFIFFAPIIKLLLKLSNVVIPLKTIFISIVLFLLIPLILSSITKLFIVKIRGKCYFENIFINKFDKLTIIGLFLTLIMIFSFNGNSILKNPLNVVLISIPLFLQTFLIFIITYILCYILKLPHKIAAPSAMIGASNFFELSVAVAIMIFGINSNVVLATTVGVLTEVPIMLFLVKITIRTEKLFDKNK